MQTTLSAIAVLGNQAIIGHVGDTRIYRVRGKEIQQLTRDHSEVSELMRMQIITAEEARHHARRHIITRTVGGEPFFAAGIPQHRSRDRRYLRIMYGRSVGTAERAGNRGDSRELLSR